MTTWIVAFIVAIALGYLAYRIMDKPGSRQ